MKAIKKVSVEIILVLTEEEANWLMVLMQNPLSDSEEINERENRKKIFQSLKETLSNET